MPERVGPYEILGRLGAGGMGTVFLGRRGGEPRVAVKVVRPELACDPAFLRMFRHEVDAARRVVGFCTARMLDADVDGPVPYLVTEYVDGVRLDRAVAGSGGLAATDLEGLAVGMAAALTAIHGAGVVHRDLKPSNVLLSYFGPKVIDFGIARALDATTAAGAVQLRSRSLVASACGSGAAWSPSSSSSTALAVGLRSGRLSMHASTSSLSGPSRPSRSGGSWVIRWASSTIVPRPNGFRPVPA